MPNISIEALKPLIPIYEPKPSKEDAAVLLALVSAYRGSDPDPQLILTKRADGLSTHAGEVSLPGGKWERQDQSLLATALRETSEEVGLNGDLVDPLGQLSPQMSIHGVRVTPVVGWVDNLPRLTANPGELESVFMVPVSFFMADERSKTHVYTVDGTNNQNWSPSWLFEGYEIWGLTARFIVDLMNTCFSANITRSNTAPEIHRTVRPGRR